MVISTEIHKLKFLCHILKVCPNLLDSHNSLQHIYIIFLRFLPLKNWIWVLLLFISLVRGVILLVGHEVFPSFMCRGGALPGWSNCSFNLHCGHSVRMVSQSFLLLGQPLFWAAMWSASHPVRSNLRRNDSLNQYHSESDVSSDVISLILVNSSTSLFQFVTDLLSLTWACTQHVWNYVFLAVFSSKGQSLVFHTGDLFTSRFRASHWHSHWVSPAHMAQEST